MMPDSNSEVVAVPAREVPLLHESDVVVAGAGVSGLAAAVASARAGARTVLVERNAFPGGVATAGLMCSVTNLFVTRDGLQVARGIAEEFVDRLVAEGGAMPQYARAGQPQIPNDPEVAKRVMITMLREAQVKTLYGTLLTQALHADGQVKALICEGKGGAFALRGRNYVDATGDVRLMQLAGAPSLTERGWLATLLFRMADVDMDATMRWLEQHPDSYSPEKDIPTSLEDTIANWRQYGVFHLPHYAGKQIAVIREALESGELPERFGHHTRDLWAMGMFSCRANRGVVLVNTCAFGGNEDDPGWKSQCEEEGRLAARFLADFLIRRFPGFEKAWLIETAQEMGTRFTRRLVGRHTLTEAEYRSGRPFEDVVGMTSHIDRTLRPPARYAKPGQIPFGCLVAEVPANAICGSGKSASTEHGGLLRGQVPCMVIGQAAGAAAALASAADMPVNQLDVARLQKQLAAQGVHLPCATVPR